jgi:hypothetical protein
MKRQWIRPIAPVYVLLASAESTYVTGQVYGERIVLNGRPYPLRMVLDQGYWPESGMTAPSDAALRRDVELAKAMGFNGVRKHQKIAINRPRTGPGCSAMPGPAAAL